MTARRTAVTLVVLPDAGDLPSWLAECAEMDAEATDRLSGKVAVPGLQMATVVTYPGLETVYGVRWVYLGWRGQVWARQFAADRAPLELKGLAGMDPAWAAQLRVGATYLWVRSTPERTPRWPLPKRSTRIIYGWLPGGGAEQPIWL